MVHRTRGGKLCAPGTGPREREGEREREREGESQHYIHSGTHSITLKTYLPKTYLPECTRDRTDRWAPGSSPGPATCSGVV